MPVRASTKPSAWEDFTEEVLFPEGGKLPPALEAAWQKGKEEHTRISG